MITYQSGQMIKILHKQTNLYSAGSQKKALTESLTAFRSQIQLKIFGLVF